MESKRISIKPIAITLVAIAVLAIVAVAFVLSGAFGQKDPGKSDDVIINSDVVVYEEEQSPFEIVKCESGSVTVTSMEGLREGAILAAGVTDKTPNGMLRRLGAVEETSDGYKFETTQAALTEAIDKCDVSYTISITENGEYEVKDTRTGAVSPLVQQAFADEGLDNLFSWDKGFAKVYAGDAIDASLKIDHGTIDMSVVNHFNAGADFDLGRLVREGGQWELFEKHLRPFTFSVGPVPVVFTNRITADLSAEGSVNVGLLAAEATIDKSFGFEYTSANGLRAINEDHSKAPEASFTQEDYLPSLTADADVELDAHFTSLLYGCAGPDFSVGLDSSTEAKLQKLLEGEDTNGAITVPGLDWKLKGALSEKVTLPIRGQFHMEDPFNVFDGGALDVTIFDTGDTITLLDINKEFGEFGRASTTANDSSGSYTTKWAHANMMTYPEFTFDLPAGWSVASDDISQSSELITVQGANGLTANFAHLGNTGGAGGVIVTAKFERVADSAFIPEMIQATDFSSLGKFAVMKVTLSDPTRKDVGDDYFADSGKRIVYAVAPVSMEGEQGISGILDAGLAFNYGGSIAFYCTAPEGGFSKQDEAAVVSMLSSFRVAG